MVVRDTDPGWGAAPVKNNGPMHSGKPHHQCQACGRQIVVSADARIIAPAQCTPREPLLRERLTLRGICRAVGGSLRGFSPVMVDRIAAGPDP